MPEFACAMSNASSADAALPVPDAAAPAEAERAGLSPKTRLILVGLLLAALFVIAKVTGITEHVTVASLREWMAAAGAWGVVLFVVVFLVGELLQVPGLIFVAAAVLSYGQVEGGVLSYLTAILSVGFSFVVVRTVGGKALGGLDKPWIQKVLARLDDRPIATIAILRVVLIMSPPLNYALALTRVKLSTYMIGSAIGLIPPILAFVVFFEQALAFFDLR
jgi:uncharacterized membrane protein YdjX (TVP38/TMEM64 family)